MAGVPAPLKLRVLSNVASSPALAVMENEPAAMAAAALTFTAVRMPPIASTIVDNWLHKLDTPPSDGKDFEAVIDTAPDVVSRAFAPIVTLGAANMIAPAPASSTVPAANSMLDESEKT